MRENRKRANEDITLSNYITITRSKLTYKITTHLNRRKTKGKRKEKEGEKE